MKQLSISGVTITEPTHRSELSDPLHLEGWDIARATFHATREDLIHQVTDPRVFRIALFLTNDPKLQLELKRAHNALEVRINRRARR